MISDAIDMLLIDTDVISSLYRLSNSEIQQVIAMMLADMTNMCDRGTNREELQQYIQQSIDYYRDPENEGRFEFVSSCEDINDRNSETYTSDEASGSVE